MIWRTPSDIWIFRRRTLRLKRQQDCTRFVARRSHEYCILQNCVSRQLPGGSAISHRGATCTYNESGAPALHGGRRSNLGLLSSGDCSFSRACRKTAMRSIRQSQDVTRCQSRSTLHFVAVIATLGVTACNGAVPTSPGGGGGTGGSDVLSIEVTCPTALLIGQKGPCVAVARLRSGQTPVVSFEATWSSTSPEVVAVDTMGVVNGRSAGQAIVSASYGGRQDSATLLVTAEDALRIASGQAQQGDFRPGNTVTMWLQGYYSVASADSGRLSLRISDQSGTITTTSPLTVAKGGDFFLLSSTFVVPQESVEVCRTAVLEVASATITEPKSNASGLWCIPIRR